MERFKRFLDELNDGYTEEVANFTYEEYGHFLQISTGFVNLTPKWRYFSLAQQIIYIIVTIYGLYVYAVSTVTLINMDITLASQAGHMFCGLLFVFFLLIFLPLNRRKLMVFFTANSVNFYSYGDSFVNNELEQWNKDMKRFKVRTVKFTAVYLAIIGCFAIVGVPLLDNYQGIKREADVVNGVHMYLPIQLWIPFEDHWWGRLSGYIFEILVSFAVMASVGTGILIAIFAVETFITQVKILLLSIQKLEERAINQCWIKYRKKLYPISCYEDENFLAEYNNCIKQNVEHHNIIVSNFGIIDDIQRWPMLIAALIVSIVIALALFLLIQGEKRLGPQIISLLCIGLETVAIATVCFRAQIMIDLGEDLYRAFYYLQWIDCNKSIINSILILNEHNRNSLTLRAGGLTRVDMELFGAICNSVYSYFNLLYAAQNQL